MLSDQQLLQYSRQIMLPQIDIEGQEKLLGAHAVVIGLGGLGSPVALFLASAGFGKITLVDYDDVDRSNIQRQIIHSRHDLGVNKAESAKKSLNAINDDCKVTSITRRLSEDELESLLDNSDVLADCSDNFSTRFLLNRVCKRKQVPLVSGAAIRFEGQLTTFLMDGNGPCYRCLYDEQSATDQTCSQNGVLGPMVGVIGSLQALEAIKVVVSPEKIRQGELLIFDGLDLDFRKLQFDKNTNCSVCSSL